jgi:uncharacterized protein YlxP (DUF503 family)
MPVVGLLSLELYLPNASSLKEKRMVLRSVKDRLRKFNIAIAETDHQNLWQRARLDVVAISTDTKTVDQALTAAENEIERVHPGLVCGSFVEFLT